MPQRTDGERRTADCPPLGQVSWRSAEGAAAAAFSGQLDALPASAPQQIKDSTHRAVYRVDLPRGRVYLKHFRAGSLRFRLRDALRGSGARRECRKALAVARRGVPTVTPLALGEESSGPLAGDSFLVTAEIAESLPLDAYLDQALPRLPPPEAATARRRLTEALAALLAQAHNAGVDHDDLHAGNVLVQPAALLALAAAGAAGLHLIDVAGVRLRNPLAWPQTCASLAMLDSSLSGRSRAWERGRFLVRYLALRPALARPALGNAAGEVAEASALHARRVRRRRDRRALATNRDFRRLQSPHGAAHTVADLPAAQVQTWLARPSAALERWRLGVEKISHTSLMVRGEVDLPQGRIEVAYKRCRPRARWKSWLPRYSGRRAVAAWRAGHALLARGVATPRPLAVLLPREGCDSYLVTQWISDAENLHLWLWRIEPLAEAQRRRRLRTAARALGALLARMHEWGVSHRDLKACNLLLAERRGEAIAYLVDLDGVRFQHRLSLDRRAADLSRLAASLERHPWITRSDRMRFLSAYLQGGGAEARERDALWRRTAALSGQHLSRLARRDEPIA